MPIGMNVVAGVVPNRTCVTPVKFTPVIVRVLEPVILPDVIERLVT